MIVYLVNKNRTNVYFDALDIAHHKSQIIQESHYYPFGANMAGLSHQELVGNRYGYNGNEVQPALSLMDFNARFYSPTLGRFTGTDPLSDDPTQFNQSPYQFSWNSPIKLNDKSGMLPPLFGLANQFANWLNNTVVSGTTNIRQSTTQTAAYNNPNVPAKTQKMSQMQQMATGANQLYDAASDAGHLTLDAIGTIPLVGEVADGLNAAWYAAEGDYVNMYFSTGAMIPVIGDVGKWSKNALKLVGRNTLQTTSGLIFGPGKKEVNKLSHVLKHTSNDMEKPLQGVFSDSGNLVGLLNDGWAIAKKGGDNVQIVNKADGTTDYIIDMGRQIGIEGGADGTGKALNRLNIRVKTGTSEVVTAFPVQ